LLKTAHAETQPLIKTHCYLEANNQK